MKPAMIVCVLVTRTPGGGSKDMDYRVAVVPKDSLPPNDKNDAMQSYKLSELRPLFEGNNSVQIAHDYRRAAPIINQARGQGRQRLGEVFYNCGNLYFDGASAPVLVEDSGHLGKNRDGSTRSSGSVARMERRRRANRNGPSSAEMD